MPLRAARRRGAIPPIPEPSAKEGGRESSSKYIEQFCIFLPSVAALATHFRLTLER
jgi:hypothetical protein